MTEPQIWVLIAVFSALMFSMIGIVSTSFVRIMRSELARVETKIDAVESRLDAKIDNLEVRLGAKIDALDRDVQAIIQRLMPERDQ